jgi:hypothetical protein
MCVDLEVTVRLDLQVDHAVTGDLIQHMFKKRYPDLQLRTPATVEVHLDRYTGFFRFAADGRAAFV